MTSRQRPSRAIAFVVPPFERAPTEAGMLMLDVYMNLASAAARAAFTGEHSMLLVPPIASLAELDALGVEGGIVCDPLRDDPVVALFEERDLPVVTIGRIPGSTSPWHVRTDNAGDTLGLLDHLAAAGADRVAMLFIDADIAWTDENTGVYLSWCAGRGQEPWLLPANPHELENSAYEIAARMLDGDDPPDAIFASAERFATGVIRAARERGLSIPRDLMVATGIDGWEARTATPPVTAIDVQPELVGTSAVDMLLALIEGRTGVKAPLVSPSQLQIRASTARSSGAL